MLLYHYFERQSGPFAPLTTLPYEEARGVLIAQKAAGKFRNPDVDGFLKKRYNRDEKLYAFFVEHGGCPQIKNPIYMFLGEQPQWMSAYEDADSIAIPMNEFDPLTVSFTYGDSFAVLNPALFGAEEYWGKVYFANEMKEIIERHGFPPYVEYDFKKGIYPVDKSIHDQLKYIEAQVWNTDVLAKYRSKWLADNPIK